jgi:hypothetical protein
MISFRINMRARKKNAINHLLRWETEFPYRGISHTLSKTAEGMMKKSYRGRMAHGTTSLYGAIKNILKQKNPQMGHGYLTGATLTGITGRAIRGWKFNFGGGASKRAGLWHGEVGLEGKWPRPGVNIRDHIPYSLLRDAGWTDTADEGSLDSDNIDLPQKFFPDSEGAKSLFGDEAERVTRRIGREPIDIELQPGATVQINERGMSIIWDKSFKESGYIDKFYPAEMLKNKIYGKDGWFRDPLYPLYLSKKQEEALFKMAQKVVFRWMEPDEAAKAFIRMEKLMTPKAKRKAAATRELRDRGPELNRLEYEQQLDMEGKVDYGYLEKATEKRIRDGMFGERVRPVTEPVKSAVTGYYPSGVKTLDKAGIIGGEKENWVKMSARQKKKLLETVNDFEKLWGFSNE